MEDSGEPVRLREQAYASFTRHLLARDLLPGQFVSQRELVAFTGLPLGAIREIVPRLEAEGLLTTIPQRGMQIAHIDVQLEARDDYPYFRAELRTRGGQEILTRSSLTRHRAGPAYAISLDVPVTALAAGEYELALKGIPAGGSVEDIGFYYFRVQKQ